MKILVSLSSYGNKNLNYLESVIQEYKSYKKYDVSIDVHCTVPLNRSDINQIVHENPPTTAFFHRKDFMSQKDNYDLFIFSEYDMLIKETAIDTYLKHDRNLPIDYSLGFIRYENTPENIQYLIDLWIIPSYDYLKNRNIEINGNYYFDLSNVFQSCFVFTRDKLKYVIDNMQFDIDINSGLGVETSSANVFLGWGHGPRGVINRVLSKDRIDLENSFIHHMADIHCNPPGVNSDYLTFRSTTVTKDKLLYDLNLQ